MLELEQLGRGVVRLTIANEEAANALTDADLVALEQGFEALSHDPSARCAILRGAGGRVFSSGYHTTQLEPQRFRARPDPISPACRAMLAGRVPVVGCINGHAYGGAVDLAATCDLRVGQQGAELVVPASRLGICYPAAGIARMSAALGRTLTMELLLTGAPVSAERAGRAGFFCCVAPAAEVDTAAIALAEQIADGAPLPVEAMRRIVLDLSTAAEACAERSDPTHAALIDACLESDDFEEGLRALALRRPPRFVRR